MRNQRRKTTEEIVKDIFIEHPDWTGPQIYDRYKIIIGNPDIAVTQNAVEKHVKVFRDRDRMIKTTGLDNPWYIGTYETPDYSIPFIFEIQNYIEKKSLLPLSIRQAKWISRFSCFYKIPMSDRETSDLFVISAYYSEREIVSGISGNKIFDTTELDKALRQGRIRELIKQDYQRMIDDLTNGNYETPDFQALEKEFEILSDEEKEKVYKETWNKLVKDLYQQEQEKAAVYMEQHPEFEENLRKEVNKYPEFKEKVSREAEEYIKNNPKATEEEVIKYLNKVMFSDLFQIIEQMEDGEQ